MSLLPNELELLSPARDIHIGMDAIIHGADAVYLGGPSFGARHNAGNSVLEIAELVEFAHRFHAKIFIALNTILHDDELESANKLIHELYDAGVDALIIQDMGIMMLDIPPIELHASTQMDIRSVEKAQFLSDVGFSQLVLARELELTEIKSIHSAIPKTALEFFIHGALCVAYSGQCYISHAQTGRSANRGDCSQACRLPYTLKDHSGRVVAFEKHLLSMKDNNQSANLEALIEAGIRSFKIEGRYKDSAYVKNITAHYRRLIDSLLEKRTDLQPSSKGKIIHNFIPDPEKTFHRGNTDYFVNGRKEDIGAFDSPKFTGLPIGEIIKKEADHLEVKTTDALANGDGLNVLIKREIVGFRASSVKEISAHHYLVYLHEMPLELKNLKPNHPLNRNLDSTWQKSLQKASATRKIGVDISVREYAGNYLLALICESGTAIEYPIDETFEIANNKEKALTTLKESLQKLGGTDFYCRSIVVDVEQLFFIPIAKINQVRREALELLTNKRKTDYKKGIRKQSATPLPNYPDKELTYLANIYNHKARLFYQKHGVTLIEPAYEAHEERGEVSVMITKHCLRYSFNLCPKQAKGITGVQGQIKAEPMQLIHNDEIIHLEFKCKPCEMHVMGKIKPHILASKLVGRAPV